MPFWRKSRQPRQEDESANHDKLDSALAEADEALAHMHRQREESETIGQTLRRIREANHFAETIFDDGMKA